MCGIGGEFNLDHLDVEQRSARVAAMVEAIRHRGPDGQAVWVDETAGVALGHRRLAIVDLSPAAAQPVQSGSRRWTLTFNGEIYNYRELRSELTASGCCFVGTGDAEVLIEAIDRWGVEPTLQRVNGMFAFAAWDSADRRLTIARDRIGEKPLYWSHAGRRFGFASELKGLTTLPWFDRTIDRSAVASVLGWGFVTHPQSMFEHTRQLPPGHLLMVEVADDWLRVREVQWWSLAATIDSGAMSRQRPVAVDVAARELEPILAAAVAGRMRSDVPLGAFLSGGVDSSLIAAFAQRSLGSTPLRTFTARFPDMGIDESSAAAEFARRLGSMNTTIDVPIGAATELIPTLASTWDEPLGDPSMLPSLLLCRFASRELSVVLAGDGGDELFAGYNRHAATGALMRKTSWLPDPLRSGIGRALGAMPNRWINGVARHALPLVPPRWRYVDVGTKAHKVAALLRADSSPWHTLAGVWPLVGVMEPSSAPPGLDAIEQLLWADTTIVLPDNMLVKMDRASMHFALEVRNPFLDSNVVDWAWRQHSSIKADAGVGKVVLRQLLRNLGHEDVAQRPKVGFDPPLAAWLRGPLRAWAGDLLSVPRAVTDGYLSRDDVSQVWREHQSGQRNNEYQLWSLLMLESWLADRDV